MARKSLTGVAVLAAAVTISSSAYAGTLRGSPSSMEQQHEVAVHEDLTFAEKAAEINKLVDSGELVEVKGNADYALSGVSFPYARPEVVLFIERLAAQYHTDLGTRLVVTSLTRPEDKQPRNAHKLSVHPAGMAVDFRVPSAARSRAWLENALLGLENSGVLDVTREKHPPHYHVAVFPAEYQAYADKRIAQEPVSGYEPVEAQPSVAPAAGAAAATVAPDQAGFPPAGVFAFVFITIAAGIGTASRVKARSNR